MKSSRAISLEVEKGEFVAVMGPSGSGKTTLLNCISCYIPADCGEIILGDRPLAALDETALAAVRNKQLGFVFQDFLLLDGLTVRQNILLPAIIGGSAGPTAETRADRLCQVFGITPIQEKYPAEISGGEKQRTAVARALINHPPAHLGGRAHGKPGLPVQPGGDCGPLNGPRQSLAATIFMVTHDSFAASFCDRVVILRDGVVWRTLEKGRHGPAIAFQDQSAGRHPGHGEGSETMQHLCPCLRAHLRRKNWRPVRAAGGAAAFFSVLLITAYACMMRSPTILTVLPEGGDCQKTGDDGVRSGGRWAVGCLPPTLPASSSGKSPGSLACFWLWVPRAGN